MPQIINTNIASINAQRNLDKSQSSNQQALQRLSSGLRINSAKDDAAGLAISTRFTSQIKGLNVAVRNAGDGIALAQTAEGALGSINDSLQRIRELAVQSANATNSDVDRDALQSEVDQLVAEITRTSEETDFNGRKLLDGSFNATFQIGANAGQTVDISIAELTADKLGVGLSAGVSAQGSGSGLQNGDLSINGVAIDPSKSSDDTASVKDAEASAIAKVAAINEKSDQTGVTAKVNTNVSSGSEMTAASTSGSIKLNGVEIDVATGGLDTAADRDSVISSINAKSDQTGVIARDGGDAGGVILEAADGRNITVELNSKGSGNLTEAATGLSAGTSYGGYTLTSKDGSDIVIEGGQGTGTGDIANAGLAAGTYSGREAAVTSSTTATGVSSIETASTFSTADLSVNANTAINATNNSFEVNVNGAGFEAVTLGTNYDSGSGVGEYDDVSQLAAQINDALTNSSNSAYAANANLRGADGNALFTASADGNKLVFTSTEEGADSSIVARTGSETIALATETAENSGVAGGNLARETLEINFAESTTLAISGGNGTISLNVNGGGATDVTVANGTYTGAQFTEALQTAINGAGLAADAVLSDDGSQVEIRSRNVGESLVVGAGSATQLTSSALQQDITKLSNGDSVISDVAGFLAGYASGSTDTFSISVDGNTAADLDLSTATTTVTDIDTLVAAINEVAAGSLTGGGITASKVGDQIVIASDSTASDRDVTIGQASTDAQTVGGVVANVAGTVASAITVDATNGTAVTGNFNVDADGNFVTADPDGAGTTYEAQQSPLVVEAGKNDTFTVAVDGGAEQTITVSAGSYNSIDELATALDGDLKSAVQTIQIADFSGATLADYNFSGATDDLVIASTFNGAAGGATDTQVVGNYAGLADVAAAQQAVVDELQADYDSTFGSGQVQVAFNNNVLELTTVNSSDSLSVTIADTGVGTSNAVTTNASGSNTPAFSIAASADKQSLTFTSNSTGSSSSVDVTNGSFAIEGGFTSGASVTQVVEPNVLENGDLVLNSTSIAGAEAKDDTASDTTALTSDAAASGIAVAAAINKSTTETGVTATVNATQVTGGGDNQGLARAANGSTGSIYVNNVETTGITLTGNETTDRQAAIDAINAIAGQTGVTAEDNGESITLTATDGRNVSVAIDNNAADNAKLGLDSTNFGNAIGLSANETGIGEADISGTSASYANTAGTTNSTVTLTSASSIVVENGGNGADELNAAGLQAGSYGGGEDGQFLKDIDISTFEGATEAITAIDNAIGQVASQRADLGAIQNRLETTVSNLQVTSENLNAANSRIQDADFAAETAELQRTNVLQQAGISVLAQANAAGQQVLSLLG